MDVDKTCAFNIMEHDAMDVGDIFRSIFSSCDVDNTGLVPVTNLIEFIKPYLLEDLNALEGLRNALDPKGVNAQVTSERFYEVMNHWSQTVATASSSEDTEFDRSHNMLAAIDDKELPYTHSTPRASLGEKLLRCKDLLNLSNVSGYSLSTSRLEHVAEPDKTVLEEEIKKLEHQLLKTTNELGMVKQQLALSEDQNDQFQQDLDRVNRRLNAEQQVNEHLQKDIKYSEELRDELNNYKKTVEELKKKLSQSEKDSLYLKNVVNEMEEEKAKLEKKIETLSKQHQDCLKELFDIKTELEAKDEQMNEISKVYGELKSKFSEQKDFIDQLREENDLLNHQKSTLEKVIKTKHSNSPHSNLGNLILDLSKTPPSPYQSQLHQSKAHSLPLLRKVLARHSSTPVTGEPSLLDASPPENFRNIPVLSPIKTCGDNQKQDSSEEDLYWKMQQGDAKSHGQDVMNGTTESLHAEMHKADPFKINDGDAYQTIIFERDQRIAELEDEIETLKTYIAEIEDRNNDFLFWLKEQEERKAELLENSFVQVTDGESAHTKIESLKQQMAQQEGTRTPDKMRVLERAVQGVAENDGRLQIEMSLQENVDSLRVELSVAQEKLAELEDGNSKLSRKNNELEEEKFVVEQDLASALAKCENLAHRISIMDKEHQQHKAKLDVEVKEFKENLEKKLVAEFEAKLKYSMDAQEKILQLNQKCDSQEDELTVLLAKLGNETRLLRHAENRITLLANEKARSQQELNCLNAAKTQLEIEIAQLKTEHAKTSAKIGNIDTLAADIQNRIINKNGVIEELKQLNRTLETNLNRAQLEIRLKVDDILDLRNEFAKESDMKNNLWKKVKILEKDLHGRKIEMDRLTEHHQSLSNSYNELNIEYNNLLIVYDLEVNKNGKLVRHVAQCNEEKLKLETELKIINAKLAELRDSTSQTIANGVLDAEEAFATIKLESDQLLEELEAKLNEESKKNRSLTSNLVEMKSNYAQNNAELDEMKRKLAEMARKLQENDAKYSLLLEESNDVLSRVKNELEEAKGSLELETEKNLKITEELNCTTEKYVKLREDLTIEVNEKSKIEIELSHTKEALEAANGGLGQKDKLLKDSVEKYDLVFQELAKAKDTIAKNDNEIKKLSSELEDTMEKLKGKSLQLEGQEKVNKELFGDVEQLRAQLTEKDSELINLKNSSKLLKATLDTIQKGNNQLTLDLKQELDAARAEKSKLTEVVYELEKRTEQLQKDNVELAAKATLTKQEKDTLNKELLLLKQESNQRLQEELAKNRALFENFSTVKKERDKLIFDLKETQALLANSQMLCAKRQTKLADQANDLQKLESLLEQTRGEMADVVRERDALKRHQLTLNGAEKGKTYSRQQITIDKLKDRIEDLENKLSAEKSTNEQLNNRLILMEDNVAGTRQEERNAQIADRESACKALVERRDEMNAEIAILEEKLDKVRDELETLDWQLENKKQTEVELRSTEDIGIQVDADQRSFKDTCEGRSIGKFTLASRSQSPDSPSPGIDSIGLTNLKGSYCTVKPPYNVHCDSVLEIPSLDVSGFADDIIEELELGDSSPRAKLDRAELEKKVTALTLRLVANDNSISERIELQTEKYRCQYEAILTLVRDISHRLRDHVCIGTAEPIVPVYVLLEEIKLRMKDLVQNAGQVGVLICENRMKRCWNLTVNYMAMLRQDNEILNNISRDITPAQTGQVGRRNQCTQEKTGSSEGKRHRRKLFVRCTKLCGSLLFVIVLAMAVSLAINLTCATESQYCPLDLIVQRINVGLPPM